MKKDKHKEKKSRSKKVKKEDDPESNKKESSSVENTYLKRIIGKEKRKYEKES